MPSSSASLITSLYVYFQAGEARDASDSDIKRMRGRVKILHKKLTDIITRKDINVLKNFLPPKRYEFVFTDMG